MYEIDTKVHELAMLYLKDSSFDSPEALARQYRNVAHAIETSLVNLQRSSPLIKP